jgi:hypothetical protein
MVQVLHPPHNFELRPFKVVEAMGLNVVALTSPVMASPNFKISSNTINWCRGY